jgi:hypothetical protein
MDLISRQGNLNSRIGGGQVIVTKRVEGKVELNDGEFAEVQTYGIDGIEKNLLLKTVQIQRQDTDDTSEQFQRRLPVGTVLEIVTTTEFTKIESRGWWALLPNVREWRSSELKLQ